MEQQQLLQADYLDILFDRRNKKYGGYDLRKHYASRAGRAAIGVLIFTASMAAIPLIMGMNEKIIAATNCPMTGPVELHTFKDVLPYHPPKPIPQSDAHTTAAQAKTFQQPTIIAPTNDVIDAPKPLDMDHAIAGLANKDGKPDALTSGTGNTSDLGIGSKTPGSFGVEMNDTKPVTLPDEMPTFNGNMSSYLQSHLNYPENARELGKEGRVLISFVVAEDGSILDANIARGVFQSLDAEALRVVKSMPRWKPGRVKGKAVKVYFSIPIGFILNDGSSN